jgi:antitoxin ParD1/3/4
METMNISLPENLRDFVQKQVETAGYGSASEYIRELIRSDQTRRAQEALEQEILKGLTSGPGKRMTKDDWQAIRQDVVRRASAKR